MLKSANKNKKTAGLNDFMTSVDMKNAIESAT